MEKRYWVYIMASKPHGTLYTGMTSDLARRIWEHKEGKVAGFTSKYGIKTLVWYEEYGDVRDAIQREKAIKDWKRAWKIELIEAQNKEWRDLYELMNA
jgi:putative endonuclease